MKNSTTILLILLLTLCLSCSNDLSRNDARKIILKNIPNEWQTFKLTFERNYSNGKIRKAYRAPVDNNLPDSFSGVLNKTIDLFLSKNPIVEEEWNPLLAPFVETDPRGFWYYVSLADANDIEVTGISGSKDDSYRKVNFNIIYKWNYNATNLGFNYDLKIERSLDFKKYDDGWRLN